MHRVPAAIGPHLPSVRRYARALAGSQARGDQYMTALLETLLAEPRISEGSPSEIRYQLFCAFNDVWTVLNASMPTAPAGGEFLSLRQRQLLLLIHIEGFSLDDAAHILGLEPEEAAQDYKQARGKLDKQPPARIMIIEDEAVLAMDISDIVERMGHSVCAVADSRHEAVAMALNTLPDLVLSDINLRNGGNGIDAVRDIIRWIGAPVIFVTAYPEMLLDGNPSEPAFVIRKPYSPEVLATSVANALSMRPPILVQETPPIAS